MTKPITVTACESGTSGRLRHGAGSIFAVDVYQIMSQEVRRLKQEKRVWVYCRIDVPEDAHGALKNQRRLLMDYAEQMGLVVAGCSEDFGSGTDFKRPGWKRTAEAVQEENVNVLVVQNISRIGRDTYWIIEYLEKLHQSGIDVHSPMEGKLSFSLQRFIGICVGGRDLSPQ